MWSGRSRPAGGRNLCCHAGFGLCACLCLCVCRLPVCVSVSLCTCACFNHLHTSYLLCAPCDVCATMGTWAGGNCLRCSVGHVIVRRGVAASPQGSFWLRDRQDKVMCVQRGGNERFL